MEEVHEIAGILVGDVFYNGPGEHKLNIELVEYPRKGDAACLEFQINDEVVLRLHVHEALHLKSVIDSLVLDYVLNEIQQRNDER